MSIKDKLQLTIVTYNRDIYLENTLKQLTDINSPVRDFDILILDNCSTDNTIDIVKSFQKDFSNISYYKNNVNIGGNGNITRAFELNTKDYLWVLGDSYIYDWTNWDEVERAINNNEKIIVATRDAIPDDNKTTSAVLSESGFLSACIFSAKVLDGIVIKLMYDNIYTMFPHVVPLVNAINNGENPYILNKGIIRHGGWTGEAAKGKYAGWYRDFSQSDIYTKNATMSYILGMSIVLSKLNDEKLKLDTFEVLYKNLQTLLSVKNPFESEVKAYAAKKNISQLGDLYTYLKSKHCKNIDQYIISQFPLQKLFINIFFRFKPNVYSIKYVTYKILQNITFGKIREKMREKKDKYKNLR